MSVSFAQYLLDVQPEYNGHKQTELQSMSFQDIRQLCLDLEEITGESFTFELWVEGGRNHKDSGTVYRQRTTKENQIILGIEEVVYDTL